MTLFSMKTKMITLCLLLFFSVTNAQHKQAYQFYNAKGKKVQYQDVLKAASKNEVVLFGEYHDNPIAHWLQLSILKDLSKQNSVILGMEMLETDNQEALDLYLKGEINQKQLDSMARLWINYKTDYKPMVDFAKSKKIPVIATNIPRRYASMVFRKDFDALNDLPENELKWIAPLPIPFDIELPSYKAMLEMMGGHAGERMPKAQAIKDATMAHFIQKNLTPNHIFLHINGTYHSDLYEGIYWYLKQHNSKMRILTIATVTKSDSLDLDPKDKNKADFILVIDEDVTKSYAQ